MKSSIKFKIGQKYRLNENTPDEDIYFEGKAKDFDDYTNQMPHFNGLVSIDNCTIEILDIQYCFGNMEILFYVIEHNLTVYLDYNYLSRFAIKMVNHNDIWYNLNE